MKFRIASLIFQGALRLPEGMWGRKALLDMSLMYLMINTMAKARRFEP